MITQSRLKELVEYNPDNGIFTLKIHRHGTTRKIGDVLGSITKTGYLETGIDNRTYYLHRLAILYVTGDFPDGHIDHINRIKTDNRIVNLRIVSCAQNMQNNIEPRKHGSLGVRGIYRHGDRFRAKINVNKTQIHLGTFNTIEEASNAYIKAKTIYHPYYEKDKI